jgi:hypothetical protein
MKNTYAFVIVIFIASAGFLSGCKKKEEAKPVSKAELLAGTTSKSWKLTAATASVSGLTINLFDTNGLYSLPACKQDDIFIFSANKTYTTNEGATSCSPASTDSGTWAFNADETQLTLTSTSGSNALPYSGVPLTVSISGSTLQGQAQNIPITASGISTTATLSFTFTAQ